MKHNNTGILGGDLSGLLLAYFLQQDKGINSIETLEKESKISGLCCSFEFDNIYYDIGLHIIFSKDSYILKFMTELLAGNIKKIKRSNKILYKGRFVPTDEMGKQYAGLTYKEMKDKFPEFFPHGASAFYGLLASSEVIKKGRLS